MFVVVCSWASCGGEELGGLQVTVRMETPQGLSLACADLGAEELELAFFAESGDQVPHDLALVDCQASSSGWATFGLRVTARSYQRVVLRFLTSAGDTVRICTSQGREDAVLEQTGVQVTGGEVSSLEFTLVGDSGPCTADTP